jgi:Uncharacterised nucleotidyltransferase
MDIAPHHSAHMPPPGTRPEIALLLCCARTRVDSGRVEQIRTLLRADLDWQYLIRETRTQGVMPLLYRSLHSNCPEAIPKTVLNQLQRHFHANAFHNLFLARELLKIFRLFEAQGIPVIPFKGPTLAALAYDDLSLRQFDDLDILIDKKDLVRAKELFIAQSYQFNLSEAQEAAYLRAHFHFHFTRADGRVIVELHWALAGKHWSFPFDFERLQARLTPVLCGGATIPSFQPEDLLLFLCVHGSRHQWQRLMWICDVAELIRVHQQMDWQRLLEQAKTSGGKRMLLLGLFLANNLLSTDLPQDILQSIQADPTVKLLAGQVWAQLFAHADQSPFRSLAFHIEVRERLQDKIQYLVRFPFRMRRQFLREAATGNEKE